MIRHLDLFSGIGGFALAVRWLGGETVAFCEIDPYCRRVINKHWPDVPIHEDVRTLGAMAADYPVCDCCGEEPWCETHQMHWGECPCLGCMSEELQEIDLMTAGVPCQPASVAGKRGGSNDDRWLWPATFDVVRRVRPKLALLENVAGLIGLQPHGLDWVCAEMEAEGYAVVPVVLGADSVGAPHRRDRVWICCWRRGVADADGAGREEHRRPEPVREELGPAERGGCEDVGDSCGSGLPWQSRGESGEVVEDGHLSNGRESKSGMGRDTHGLPAGMVRRWPSRPGESQYEWEPPRTVPTVRGSNRSHRLKALGNSIVPQVAYTVLLAMLETEPPMT